MQNKGFVRVFAVLLTLVCLFYLSFSAVTKYYTKKAEEHAGGDNVKLGLYLDSLSTEKVWLGYYTFKQCREMEIGLGLDLKGGMNVVLEISTADVLRSLSDNNTDPNFNKALAAASAKQAGGNQDYISLFVKEYEKIDPNAKLSSIFSTFKLKNKITPQTTNQEVETILRNECKDAIDNSFNVLRTRIDRFGVVAPNIQRLDKDGRILVELPGVKDEKRVYNLLKGSANLEFWTTYDLSEIYQELIAANSIIAEIEKNAVEKTDSLIPAEVTITDSLVVAATPAANDSISDIKEVTADVKDEMGEQQNPLFSKLMPYISQQGIGQGPAVGQAHYKDTAAINQYLSLKAVRDVLPRNLIFKWSVKAIDEKDQYYQLVALKVTTRNGRAPLEGDVIIDAKEDFDRTTNSAVVSMSMNAEGSKTWARLTKENIGKCIAIVLDDYVYSFPRVNDEITGGNSQISGNFTPEEAKDLSNVLKSGKMAARVNIVSNDVVGPSLGQEAIQSGVWSFIFALVILMAYMMSVYGVIPGLIANLGLIVNMFFTMGILASFQAVLTLSGIAGLVLSLGMAVDANVLIYERAKEELRLGKNLKKSVEEAYKNAFSAIFDSNLTSIITGLVLFYFGTGPIKGFATTLIIGIVSSFFVTIFLSRMVYERGLDLGWFKNITFTTKLTKNFLANTHINFLSHRKTGYIISSIAILICVASFFTRGLSLGIDFSGGSNYIVRFDEAVKPTDVANLLKPQFEDYSISAITIGSDDQVRISTNYKIADTQNDIDAEIKTKLYEGLKPMLGDKSYDEFVSENIQSSQKVGPSIAEDITTGAIWAVFFSMIGMGIYILIRFRDIAFSVGTVASVAHNTLLIIGFYSIFYGFLPFSMEIDQSFIAAILTVIGYSVNDTVVIFDRIREVNTLYPKNDKASLINGALNSTLARTFNTSISTAIVLLCIFILGGDTIRSFTFAMLFGVVVGTYATLFIAVPFAYEIQKRKVEKKQALAK